MSRATRHPEPIGLVIEPLPDPGLGPNSRIHFRALARLKKRARLLAHLLALDAINAGPARGLPWPAATVFVRWLDRQDYGRDRDNALATLKSHIDGLADAGIVTNDRLFTFAPVELGTCRARPRVEIRIERTDPDGD